MSSEKTMPTYSIYVNPKDLMALRQDIWHGELAKARLVIDENWHNIKLAYRGSHIRKFKKKSYHIVFQRLTANVKELHLNAEYKDRSLLRNKLSLDFFSSIGTLSPESHHVILNVNGRFQGVYLQLESVDKHFLKKRHLPYGPIYYAEDDDANFSLISPFSHKPKEKFESGYSQKEGDDEDDDHLQEFIYQLNTIPQAEFDREIIKYIDVEKYLCWLSGVVCTQNYDGFIHNYALYRRGDTGLYELIPWDYDATWGRNINGKIMKYDRVPVTGYNTLTARLLDVSAFRKKYRRLLEDILNQQFTVDFLQPEILDMHKLLRPHVLKDPYIKQDIGRFDDEPESIFQFIQQRNQYLRKHLSDLE